MIIPKRRKALIFETNLVEEEDHNKTSQAGLAELLAEDKIELKKEFQEQMSDWVCESLRPISCVEDKGFREIIQ